MIPIKTPANWPWVAIGEIVDLVGGGTPSRRNPTYFTGSFPWLTGYDLPEDRVSVITEGREKITQEAIDQSATNLVPEKTVLLTTRVTVGKTAVTEIPLCFSQDVTGVILRFPEIIDPYFVAHYLLAIRERFLRLNRGTTIQGVIREDVGRIKIPLPPFPEQQRIVDILQQADALLQERHEADNCATQLLPAVFHKMFGDFISENPKIPMLSLDQVADVVSGVAKGRNLVGTITVPYLRVANVQAGFLDLSDIKTIQALPEEVEMLRLQKGDVLLTEGGDFDKLGRGALVTKEPPSNCIHQNHIFRVRVNNSQLVPIFFAHFLQTEFARNYFLRSAKKTTNLASINLSQLKALPVPIPPMEQQLKFAVQAEAIQRIEQEQSITQIQIKNLIQSITSSAFTGQLTVVWNEWRIDELADAARQRDELLSQRGLAIQPIIEVEEPIIVPFVFNETHPRYFMLRDLSDEQRRLYQAALSTQGFFTPQSLVEDNGWDLERVQRGLTLLATAGLLVRVSIPVNPDGRGIIYRSVYRTLRSDEDAETVRDIDLQTLIRAYPDLQQT